MTDTTTQPLSPQVATELYRAAWLAHVEAYNQAAMLSHDAHVPAVLPRWQAALVKRDAAFERLRFAQARLREALLASGYTETEAAVRRAEIDHHRHSGAPLSEHVATERYRAAWLAHVEAYNQAAEPLAQMALVEREAAFENFRFAQAQLREALLAIGYTETEARLTITRASRGLTTLPAGAQETEAE